MSWRHNNIPSARSGSVGRCAVAESDYSANTPTRDPCSLSRRTSEAETEIRANVPPEFYTWRLRLVGDKRFCHVSRGHTVSEASSGRRGQHTSFGRQPPSRSHAMTVTSTNVTCSHSPDQVGVHKIGRQEDSPHKNPVILRTGYHRSRGVLSGRSNTVNEQSGAVLGSAELFDRCRSETSTTPVTTSSVSATKQCMYLSNGDSPSVIDERGMVTPTHIPGQSRQYWTHLEKYDLDLQRLADDTTHETQLSPVTISSGYESDYIPSPTLPSEMSPAITRDHYSSQLKADDSNTGHYSVSDAYQCSNTWTKFTNYPQSDTGTKFASYPLSDSYPSSGTSARLANYTLSDTYPTTDTGAKFASKRFSSLRRHPEKRRVSSSDVTSRNIDPLLLFSLRYELDTRSAAKSHKQNHKLAKVARSMYEIIHDLRKQGCSLKSKRQTADSSSQSQCGCQATGFPRFSPISMNMNTRSDVNIHNDGDDDSEGYLKPRPVADDSCIPVDSRVPVDPPACVLRDRVSVHSPVCSSRNKIFPLGNSYSPITRVQPVQNASEKLVQPTLVGQNNIRMEETSVKCPNRPDVKTVRAVLQEKNFNSQKVKPVAKLQCVKARDPQSDSEHIYETIPGDENMVHIVPHHENPKLAKWLTVPNLTGSTGTNIPPALPVRRYNKGSATDISATKCPQTSSSSLLSSTAHQHHGGVKPATAAASLCLSSDILDSESNSAVYAKVCKLSKTSDDEDMSCLGLPVLITAKKHDDDVDDGLYTEVMRFDHMRTGLSQSEPASRRHVYLTDVSSENYCRLEPIQTADDINEWSSGDILNYIDGIHDNNSPKRRENILQLLGNSKTCAKLSESLEIETRLLHKGLLLSAWDDDDDDVMDMIPASDPPLVFDVRHLEPTYV
ncbi:uncharacterized protein LOC121369311 [Gigantopelta aegis]|uniref:uncharacterized protein LOC121369311 n=1 Tax=Gigantopelta aegis TaxID=1735272 RepID=UPI001B887F98|nr:uncharacterized protein LOC121369311 [Gigantopelta aegis]